MPLRWTLFASVLFVSLSLVPGGAHLLALPNKIGMNAGDYLIAQQLYRGWSYLGIVIVGALASTSILLYEVRHSRRLLTPAAAALACLLATQLIFWTLNFPANQQTHNWVSLPANWESLRLRWELGHAASAILTFASLVALLTVTVRGAADAPETPPPPIAAYIPG